MTAKHRKNVRPVENPVQMAPRHKDTTVEVDGPSRASVVRELSLADLMGAVVVPPHIRAMGRA